MKVGATVRPRQESLGTALAVAGRPVPQPSMRYRPGHPTFTAPAQRAALPVKSTGGVNSTQLASYLKAVQGGT
jgi:hypothetical protein